MFCGLNLAQSQRGKIDKFYSWALANGSRIYCDYLPQCESSWEPDPDIGGWGVITAFIVTAWVTILVAAINAAHPTRDTYQRFRDWYPQRHCPPDKQAVSKCHTLRTRLEQFTDHALLALCDLQLVTGTAILVAGFGQWSTISFYHRAIVVSLCYLTLSSFWASCASGYRTIQFKKPSVWERNRERIRSVCIIIAVVLLAMFNALQLLSEEQDWDPFASGKCYRFHDYSTTASSWLWVAGLSLFALTLSLQLMVQLHPHGQKKLEDFTNQFPNSLKKLGRLCVAKQDKVLACFCDCQKSVTLKARAQTVISLLIRSFQLIGLAVVIIVTWSFLQFWAIWSAGRGFQAVEVAFYAGFVAWSTFDVIDLKLSNDSLLTGSEISWGFGQVLPLYLLLMLGFNLFNVAEEVFDTEQSDQHVNVPKRLVVTADVGKWAVVHDSA